MAKFVPFNVAGLADQTVIVNADLVRCLKALGEDRTRIYFDENHTVDVAGGGLEIVQRLAQ